MKTKRMVAFLSVFLVVTAFATPAAPMSAESSECTLLTASAPPVGTGPCPGVRPGAIVGSDRGVCTMNFLFADEKGSRYIGAAGHCTLTGNGEMVFPPGRGPVARDAEGTRIGEIAYAVVKGDKDFALIRLDPGVKANAQMCHFGGPTGINDDRTDEMVILHYYGNGIGIGNLSVINQPVVPARTAVAENMADPDMVRARGAAIFGDSGSGVISDDGRAVGALVAIGAGFIQITRLEPQLQRAEQMMHVRLRIQKADYDATS